MDLISHIIRTALPELGVGSVEATPSPSPEVSSDDEASEDSAKDEGQGPVLSDYYVVRSPATFTSNGLRVSDTKESQCVWQLKPVDKAQAKIVTCTAIGFEDKEVSEQARRVYNHLSSMESWYRRLVANRRLDNRGIFLIARLIA